VGFFFKDKKVSRSFEEIKLHTNKVLVPDTRYNVQNSQIWELKYIKDKEDPQEKTKEAKNKSSDTNKIKNSNDWQKEPPFTNILSLLTKTEWRFWSNKRRKTSEID